MRRTLLAFALLALAPAPAGADELAAAIDSAAAAVEPRVIAWRRDFHEHPELSYQEQRTAGVVEKELAALGIETRRIAKTGVIGLLRGAKPGPVVALRADMDALPVVEATGLAFASKLRATYLGREVGVMHACGHDAHVAILLGVAHVLAGQREQLPGSVLFLFQPAEEGGVPGEVSGAERMLQEGAFADSKPAAVFGLHVMPELAVGEIGLLAGPSMAASDRFEIRVRGRQTHAAMPWAGIDPLPVAARILLAIEAIPARELDVRSPAIVSVGAIHGGVRNNILPEEAELLGTIRTFTPAAREKAHARVREIAEKTAEASRATAEVTIEKGYPVTVNDPALTARVRPLLERVAGAGRVIESLPHTGAEDFSFFANQVPGVFFRLGVRDPAVAAEDAAPNHSPRFLVDERGLLLGVRALARLAADHNSGR